MKIVLVAVAVLSFAIYAVAIQRLFSREQGVAPPMRALQVLGSMFALVHVLAIWSTAYISAIQSMLALLAYTLGLLLFFAAKRAMGNRRLALAFSRHEPKQIIDSGIYARIRHPFYCAYTLTWLGGVVAAPCVWTIVTAVVMFGFYFAAARAEERMFMSSDMGMAYGKYRKTSGMFIPRSRLCKAQVSGTSPH